MRAVSSEGDEYHYARGSIQARPGIVNAEAALARRVDYARCSIVDSPPAHRDSVYHGQRAPNPQETSMRRFDLALPNSVDDCLKILAERGAQAEAGRGRHRPPAPDEERALQARRGGGPVRHGPASVPGPERQRPAHRRRRHRARRSSWSPALGGPLSGDGGERGAGRLAAGAQPGDRRRQPLQRRAVGRHGAAAAGARGRRGHRGAERASGAVPLAEFFLGVRQHGARRRTSCWWRSSCRRRARAAAAATCATRPAASSTSPWSASPRSSRSPTARARRRASRWPRSRPTPVRATAAEQALEGQAVTPERHRARGHSWPSRRPGRSAISAAPPTSAVIWSAS